MNATELTADDRSSLADVEQLVANASGAAAKATSNAAGLETREYPAGSLRLAREDVRESYLKSQRALDRLESLIGYFDDGHGTPMPRQITSEHAERIKDDYDGPVRNLALMLLEFNRRKWLQRKPDTYGAQQVERHGLTDNQREWLNALRESWRAHDEVYDPRSIDDERLSNNLQTVVSEARNENWGNVRLNLETALEGVEALEERDSE